MLSEFRLYLVSLFCIRLHGDLWVERRASNGGCSIYGPPEQLVDVYHDHVLTSVLLAAPSGELAEEVAREQWLNTYPEAEGYAGHNVRAALVSKSFVEAQLAKVDDGASSVDDLPLLN